MMEVSYTTSRDDFVAYCEHVASRSHALRWQGIASRVALPLVCWISAALVARCDALSASLLVGCGAAYALLYPSVARALLVAASRSSARHRDLRGVIGPITLILTDEEMTERTETLVTVARWKDMKGAEIVHNTLYTYVTDVLAAIVPKHGFEYAGDYDAVCMFVLAKLSKRNA